MRVLHVVSSLGPGGAERAMANVVLGLCDRGIDATVVSVTDNGRIGQELAAAGVPVSALGVRGPLGAMRGVRLLRRLVAAAKPDLIQGWMYHGNLFACLGRPTGRPMAFGIRHSLPTLAEERPLTRFVIRAGALLSARANAIVYNTKASIPQHERIGYSSEGATWIPNGFDTDRFCPDPVARARVRDELGIGHATPLVGLVARYHPIKDQSMFLEAAALVASRMPDARFLLVGRGVDEECNGLPSLARRLRLDSRAIFVGDRSDTAAVMNALDVSCLTSRSEGFPNVVAEAMSCGVPVVATEVGAVPEIVGDTGRIVPPGDADGLAQSVLGILQESPAARSAAAQAARARIVERFSKEAMLEAFAKLYLGLAG